MSQKKIISKSKIVAGEESFYNEDYESAMEYFQSAADSGEPRGLTYLSSMYEDGHGVEIDESKTISLLHEAAELGDTEAFNRLGFLHTVGKFVPKDLHAAVEYHKVAAKQGHANSQCDLGRFYMEGLGVEKNFHEARKWYEIASKADHVEAQYGLAALLLSNRVDVLEGMKWLEKVAKSGNVNAQYELGGLKVGDRYPELKDYEGSDYWLRVASQNGSVDAIYMMANRFEHGIGISRDYKKAKEHYWEAHCLGNIEATFALGTLYEHGLAVEKDYKTAFKFYHQAADKFHLSALFNLGRFYQFGWNVTADYSQAYRYYLLAAERGHRKCQYMVGDTLLKGYEGIPVDLNAGANWIERAAIGGLNKAQDLIGVCYMTGNGVVQNMALAEKWFRLAVVDGDARTQHHLAYLIIRKENPKRDDYYEALKWLIFSYNKLDKEPKDEKDSLNKLIQYDYDFIESKLSIEEFDEATKLALSDMEKSFKIEQSDMR